MAAALERLRPPLSAGETGTGRTFSLFPRCRTGAAAGGGKVKKVAPSPSGALRDLAGLEAARADAHALGRLAHEHLHALDVRLEGALLAARDADADAALLLRDAAPLDLAAD